MTKVKFYGNISSEGPLGLLKWRPNVVHIPSEETPIGILNLLTLGAVEIHELELVMRVTLSEWHHESDKMHSLFWLQNGVFRTDPERWPAWNDRIIGFANARGPGRNAVEVKVDLGADEHRASRKKEWPLGRPLDLAYRIEGREASLTVDGTTVTLTLGADYMPFRVTDGGLMLYVGHTNEQSAYEHGPERASLGWRYEVLSATARTTADEVEDPPPAPPGDEPEEEEGGGRGRPLSTAEEREILRKVRALYKLHGPKSEEKA